MLQGRINRISCHYGTLHGEQNAGGKDRIDKGEGIAQQHVVLAVRTVRKIRVISRGLDVVHEFGTMQTLGKRCAGLDVVAQELLETAVSSRFHMIRPSHHADARDAIHQRNEPEPAVIEPENGDVAFGLALVTHRATHMAVHCRAVVLGVAVLGLHFVGKERVAPRGIDEKPRLPFGLRSIVHHGGDASAGATRMIFRQEFHILGTAAFDNFRAFLPGIADQNLVKLGSRHLIGHRHGFIPGFGEVEHLLVRMMRGYEFRTPFFHADGANLVAHTQPIKQRHIGRQ